MYLGRAAEFPFAPERKYTPCDAGKRQLWALRGPLGLVPQRHRPSHTCHGADNRALVDALAASNGLARGVATVRKDVTNQELRTLNAAGVRGVRFNFVKRLVDKLPHEDLGIIRREDRSLGMAHRDLL